MQARPLRSCQLPACRQRRRPCRPRREACGGAARAAEPAAAGPASVWRASRCVSLFAGPTLEVLRPNHILNGSECAELTGMPAIRRCWYQCVNTARATPVNAVYSSMPGWAAVSCGAKAPHAVLCRSAGNRSPAGGACRAADRPAAHPASARAADPGTRRICGRANAAPERGCRARAGRTQRPPDRGARLLWRPLPCAYP
jgi:hypothetical protein